MVACGCMWLQECISSDGQKCYELDDLDGQRLLVNAGEFQRATRLQHGYALTIHKFQVPLSPFALSLLPVLRLTVIPRQGSEAENVLYVMPFDNKFMTSQTLYTAVTRGKKNVFIVGEFLGGLWRQTSSWEGLGASVRMNFDKIPLTRGNIFFYSELCL